MAITFTVPNLIKERKYPFIVALSLLLICFTILLFTNATPYQLFVYSSTDTSTHPLKPHTPSVSVPPPKKGTSVVANANLDFGFDWKLCKGPVAVDYIPCLDNFKAIKALKSRRHMEHRERHCPDPSPRCLVPLPSGYRIPLPWPKSRDMVRLILR